MSTDRTDQYPEVSSDDSTLVPPQGHPQSEWPKKIRTLSAGELDRLTIDGAGRFYWDGHLVNYQGPDARSAETPVHEIPATSPAGRSPDAAAVDLDALAILDRAALELSGQPTEAVAVQPAAEAEAKQDDLKASMEQYLSSGHAARAVIVAAPAAVAVTAAPAPVIPIPDPALALDARPLATERAVVSAMVSPLPALSDKVRVSLSGWQCVGLVLVLLGLLVGAAGVAAQGFVVAHDWGCRAGVLKSYCPALPAAPKPLAGSDIPA